MVSQKNVVGLCRIPCRFESQFRLRPDRSVPDGKGDEMQVPSGQRKTQRSDLIDATEEHTINQ